MTFKLVFTADVGEVADLKGLRDQIKICFEPLGELRLTNVFQIQDGAAPQKAEYGAYGHVMLTDGQYSELVKRFGRERAEVLIEELSWKLYQKGYRFRDHFSVIVEWAKGREDTKKPGEAQSFNVDDFFKANVERI